MITEHFVKNSVLHLYVCMYVCNTFLFIYYLLLISKMSEKMTFYRAICHEQV